MRYCLYTLTDPRTGQVRYVGKTKDIKQRLQGHISAYTSRSNKKDAWIDELRDQGLSPIVTVIEEIDAERVNSREAYWIYTYLDQGIALLNSLTAIKRSLRRSSNGDSKETED